MEPAGVPESPGVGEKGHSSAVSTPSYASSVRKSDGSGSTPPATPPGKPRPQAQDTAPWAVDSYANVLRRQDRGGPQELTLEQLVDESYHTGRVCHTFTLYHTHIYPHKLILHTQGVRFKLVLLGLGYI